MYPGQRPRARGCLSLKYKMGTVIDMEYALSSIRDDGKYRLRLGSRGGWPGTFMETIVTHAVFSWKEVRSGSPYLPWVGYGRQKDVGGVIVVDDTKVPITKLSKGDGEVILSGRALKEFLMVTKRESAALVYTGIGANCYTPVLKALNAAIEVMEEEHAERGGTRDRINKAKILQHELMGSNLGMGTRITNWRIAAGAILCTAVYMFGSTVMAAVTDTYTRQYS